LGPPAGAATECSPANVFVASLVPHEHVRRDGDVTSTTAPATGTTTSTRGIWLTLIDTTITNIAAPGIVRHIGCGEALVKWLGAPYALALGSLLALGGRLGDRFGQRRTFLIGMTGFVVASALVGLARPRPSLSLHAYCRACPASLSVLTGAAWMRHCLRDGSRRVPAVV
jgi:MFS family permease